MAKPKKISPTYFKFVNPLIVLITGAAVYLMVMAWLNPEGVSPMIFGRVADFISWVGTEHNNVMKQLTLCTVAIHCFEAMVALYMCQKLGLDSTVTVYWMIQTLLMGFFSLRFLVWPAREDKGKNASKKSK